MRASVTIATMMTTVSNSSTRMGPIKKVSAIQPGSANVWTRAPTYIKKMAATRKWMPKEVSSWVNSDEPRTRLNAIRSMSTLVTTDTTTIMGATRYHDQPLLNAA